MKTIDTVWHVFLRPVGGSISIRRDEGDGKVNEVASEAFIRVYFLWKTHEFLCIQIDLRNLLCPTFSLPWQSLLVSEE